MIESGTDWLGAEYKRTDHDFTFRHLHAIRNDTDWDSFQNLRNLIHGYEKCRAVSGYKGLTDSEGEQP